MNSNTSLFNFAMASIMGCAISVFLVLSFTRATDNITVKAINGMTSLFDACLTMFEGKKLTMVSTMLGTSLGT